MKKKVAYFFTSYRRMWRAGGMVYAGTRYIPAIPGDFSWMENVQSAIEFRGETAGERNLKIGYWRPTLTERKLCGILPGVYFVEMVPNGT